MPNGNPEFHSEEFKDLEIFFSQFAVELEDFASVRNLSLDKYYHDAPSWRFNFRHPNGGVASIEVSKRSDNSIDVQAYWWIDDFHTFTRSIKSEKAAAIESPRTELTKVLEAKFDEILSWGLDQWTDVASGYEQLWKPHGKDWIEKDPENYPIPNC